jgi:predicted DNA-binding protein
MATLRTNIYLTEKQKASLEKLSERTGAPVAELVRRAIDAYLVFEKEGVEVNEASSNLHSREHCRPTSGDSTLRLARNGRAARIRNRV